MAAGLGLLRKDIDAFREAVNAGAQKLDAEDFLPTENITGVLATEDIDLELLDLLELSLRCQLIEELAAPIQ